LENGKKEKGIKEQDIIEEKKEGNDNKIKEKQL